MLYIRFFIFRDDSISISIKKGKWLDVFRLNFTKHGELASFVYKRNHKVSQLQGDRAVITYEGTVVAAVHISDLTLV